MSYKISPDKHNNILLSKDNFSCQIIKLSCQKKKFKFLVRNTFIENEVQIAIKNYTLLLPLSPSITLESKEKPKQYRQLCADTCLESKVLPPTAMQSYR